MYYAELSTVLKTLTHRLHFGLGCANDTECLDDQICVKNNCQDPCTTHSCGENAECRVLSRSPTCFCRYGYFGNPQASCQPTQQGKIYNF